MLYKNSLKENFKTKYLISSTSVVLCCVLLLITFSNYNSYIKQNKVLNELQFQLAKVNDTFHRFALVNSDVNRSTLKTEVEFFSDLIKEKLHLLKDEELLKSLGVFIDFVDHKLNMEDVMKNRLDSYLFKSTSELTKSIDLVCNTLYEKFKIKRLIYNISTFITIILSIFWLLYNRNSFYKKNIAGGMEQVLSFAKRIASGHLVKEECKIDDENKIKELHDVLNNMCEVYQDVMHNIIHSADNIATASLQLSSTSQQLSQGANEQSVSVEEISSTIEQITISIEQSKENAFLTEQISEEALQGIFEVSDESLKSVKASEDITKELGVLNHITFQTNILALNAAIEAARIGNLGRGFGVVASEVRNLADNSKMASEEIYSLANSALNISKESCDKLMNILPEVQKTSALLQEIASTSNEQANGASQINSAVQQLNNVTQQNAAASEELASNAEEMSSQAELLKKSMGFFVMSEKEDVM